MDKTQVTIKIWKSTRKKLRKLYAELDKPMVEILNDLIDEKLNEIEELEEYKENV